MNNQISKPVLVCLTLYITSLFAANTLGIKLMPFIFGTHLSVAIFSFPIVFIMTDMIGEVYGKKMAKNFVLAGVISITVFLLYSLISAITPWSKDGLWVKEGYNQIFGLSVRFSIASLVAYAVGEYQDVFSFFFLRAKIGEKYFWLRSNLSNIWSQLIDTVMFMSIAFIGVYPLKTILLILIPWWAYKVLMGFLYTPLSYLGVSLLKKYEKKEQTIFTTETHEPSFLKANINKRSQMLLMILTIGVLTAGGFFASSQLNRAKETVTAKMVYDHARAWETGNEELLSSLLHKDVMFAYPGRRLNKQQTLEDLRGFRDSHENTKVYIHDIVIDGDNLAVEWQFATTKRETGRREVVSDAIVGKVKDGQFIVWKEYLDGRVKGLQAEGILSFEEGEEPFPWPTKVQSTSSKINH